MLLKLVFFFVSFCLSVDVFINIWLVIFVSFYCLLGDEDIML